MTPRDAAHRANPVNSALRTTDVIPQTRRSELLTRLIRLDASMPTAPKPIRTLVSRYDPAVFETRRRQLRVRLAVSDDNAWDAVVADGAATIAPAAERPDALLTAETETWRQIADDLRGGMAAYQSGRLSVRHNLHVGVGFLAATSGATEPGRLRFRTVATSGARLSITEAGTGSPVLALHGLGGTKGSFLPTVAALSDRFRVIAVDLPGFGDSDKPIGAAYDARFFARAGIDLLDTLALERVHLIGNSLGGRIALEIALSHPGRVGRLALLAPSLAWRRDRPWVPLLRLTRPELGLVQLAPRPMVDAIVRRVIPGADEGWTAAGVDEFLRAYLTPAGRAAFYAAARQIYLEEPHGEKGFWTRLQTLQPDALFVWGRRDKLVPIAFERHVVEALPHALHLELDCGHVPQVERPKQTHAALAAFLSEAPGDVTRTGSHRAV
jgi:pimeloyl-ACP methyl ester carboxylesterase